jgi:hypothetical protein
MRRHHRLVVFATVAGAAMVVGGWVMQGTDYIPGFLLQIGSTLVLLVPITLLERRLTNTEQNTEELNRGLRRVGEQLNRTAQQVSELQRPSVEEGFTHREAALSDAESRRDQSSVLRALREARLIGAVSEHGVRVAPEGSRCCLRFRLPDDDRHGGGDRSPVRVRLESEDGTEVSAWEEWKPGEPERRVCRRLDAAARAGGLDSERLSGLPVDGLITLLRLAAQARSGDGRDLGAVVQLVTPDWVVSDEGLYARTLPYKIPRAAIDRDLSDAALTRYRDHHAPLADHAELAMAMQLARVGYRAALQRSGPADGSPAGPSVDPDPAV